MRRSAFSLTQRLALEACTQCGQCLEVCPAVAASQDARLSGQSRIQELKTLLRQQNPLVQKLLALCGKKPNTDDNTLTDYGTSVFRCSLCGDCQEVSPVSLPLKELWLTLRSELAASKHAPSKIAMIRDNLNASHNVFDEDNDERGDWVDDMRRPPRKGVVHKQAEVVYFTGCVGAYFPLAQKIPMAFVEILSAGEIDFTIMGPDEWCCGFPLLGAGQAKDLPSIVEHNVAEVKKRQAKRVVFTCPSCLQIWREAYPPEFELLHASELTQELVLQKKLPLGELDLTVTYHDPCDLGRGARVFDSPREVISALPGVKLVEMQHNREHCLCCGGGGNLEMIDPALSAQMSARKVEEALATGAQAIVTSCQQCVRTMTTYVRRNKITLEVLDITQLVSRAVAAAKK